MSYEMRRPGTIQIDAFIASLEVQLREEVRRQARRILPTRWHRGVRALKTLVRPLLQTGAMVLTSVAVIVAVGVAPASLPGAPPVDTRLAVPTPRADFIVSDVAVSGRHTVVIRVMAEPATETAFDKPDTVRLNLE
jgi:hypothetical protein